MDLEDEFGENAYNSNTFLNYKCNVFGKMLMKSIKDGYDSIQFIKEVMTNQNIAMSVFMCDDSQNWCDATFLYDTIVREMQADIPKGETWPEYELWFIGYLYKYWINTRKALRKEILAMMPPELFHTRFGFYHTQGWDFIINEAIAEYKA